MSLARGGAAHARTWTSIGGAPALRERMTSVKSVRGCFDARVRTDGKGPAAAGRVSTLYTNGTRKLCVVGPRFQRIARGTWRLARTGQFSSTGAGGLACV